MEAIKTPNDMSDNEFFRAEYRKRIDSYGDECVVPIVFMGNQGFELTPSYGEHDSSAQLNAEWLVSMFKIAIDNYAEQHLEDVLGEVEKKIKEKKLSEPILELEDSLKPYSLGFANGAKWLLNLLKQRKG